jgi:pimeloyl-ACP methyl ester carboxylesterase
VRADEILLPSDHDLLVGRHRLHYLDWDGPSNRQVVFLHGGGLTAHTWDLVCLALRPAYRCLAIDLRGHGDSEWSPNMRYEIDDHVADLTGFVAELGLDGFALVGMSLGGGASMVYAAGAGDRLTGLCLVDVGPRVQPAGTRRIREFMMEPDELASVEDFVDRAIKFNPARDRELLRRSLLYNLHQLPDGTWTWKYDRRHRGPSAFESAEQRLAQLSDSVGQIRCSTLVVRGERSDVFSAADAEELARSLPDGRAVTVAGAGHTVQGDNPKGLLEVLEPFLDSCFDARE